MYKRQKLGEYFKDFTCPAYTGRLKGENIRIIMERNGLSEAVYVGDTQGDANSCKEAEIPMIYAAYGLSLIHICCRSRNFWSIMIS